MRHPDMCSASSTAVFIDSTMLSILTTVPFLISLAGDVPMPIMSIPVSVISPTIAVVFVVPISSPTSTLLLFLIRIFPLSGLAFKILFEFTIYDMYPEDQYLESFVFCLPMIGAIIDLLENHSNTKESEEEVKIEIL